MFVIRCFCVSTYSGTCPGGMTMLMTSLMSLYFMILSLEVVLVKEGEAFTCKSKSLDYPQCRMPSSNTNNMLHLVPNGFLIETKTLHRFVIWTKITNSKRFVYLTLLQWN